MAYSFTDENDDNKMGPKMVQKFDFCHNNLIKLNLLSILLAILFIAPIIINFVD